MIDSWLSQPPLYILSPNVELIFFPHYSSNPNSTFSKLDTSSIMKDNLFEPRLMTLASSDENLTIRNAAIKTLENSYNRIL